MLMAPGGEATMCDTIVALRIPVGWCFMAARPDTSPVLCSMGMCLSCWGWLYLHTQLPCLTLHCGEVAHACGSSTSGGSTLSPRALLSHASLCVPSPCSSASSSGSPRPGSVAPAARASTELCPASPGIHPRCRLACLAGAARGLRGCGALPGAAALVTSGCCFQPLALLSLPPRRAPTAPRAAWPRPPGERGGGGRAVPRRAEPRGRQRPGPPR